MQNGLWCIDGDDLVIVTETKGRRRRIDVELQRLEKEAKVANRATSEQTNGSLKVPLWHQGELYALGVVTDRRPCEALIGVAKKRNRVVCSLLILGKSCKTRKKVFTSSFSQMEDESRALIQRNSRY